MKRYRTTAIDALVALLMICAAAQAYAFDRTSPDEALRFGEDLIVNLDSVFPERNRSAEGAELEPLALRWVGVASFDDGTDVDAETAWRKHLEVNHSALESDYDGLHTKSAGFERPGYQVWSAVNLATGFEYEVELPEEFGRKLYRHVEQLGWNAGHEGPPSANDVSTAEGDPKGWSNGVDTRTRRFDNMTYPYRAIGQMGGSTTSGCTGTLVGRRHVLTAAHCLWNMGADSWVSISGTRFRPGREGTCNNAACEPYGGFNARWYFTPAEFRQVDNNWTYDYGVMVTLGNPGNMTGWLGYVATSQDTINSYCDRVPFGQGYVGGNCFSRGYPGCGFSEAPASCQQGWAYQDLNPCEIGSFASTGGDGWESRFSTNCDLGRGHSGAALFTDVWNGSGRVIFGVASTHTCTICGPGDDWPNWFRRVTPDVLSAISYFKSVFP